MSLEKRRRSISLRLRSIFRRNTVEQELDEELQFHVERQIAHEMAKGKTREEARHDALRLIDGIEQKKEECRDMRRVNLMENLLRDLRLGFRALRKSPAFTAIAVLTLTLGIGANTAIFSVINMVLLRPLPYPQPDQLVRLYETNTSITANHDSVSVPNFLDWRAQSHTHSAMNALRWQAVSLTGNASPEFFYAQRVTSGMLTMLGTQPVFGRDISEHDAVEGQDRVALISHELWIRRFAAEPSILGRQINLNFEPHTIIGVLPPGFRTPSQYGSTEPADLLLPLTFQRSELQNRGNHNLQVFARLRPGVTPSQAQMEMNGIAEQLARTYQNNQGRGVRLLPLLEEIAGGYRTSLVVIFGAAGTILLISCANLANALLARGIGQQQEIAVRFALGATRISIVRQVLVQNLILAATGCISGIVAAFWVVKALHALAPARVPRMDEVAVDGTTLMFAAGISILTGLAFGLLPAFQLSSSHPYDAMKGRGVSATRSNVLRWRNALVVAQVMLSIVLLVGAGLLLRSFASLRGVDVGFQPGRTLAMNIMLPRSRYPDQTKRLQFFATLADRIRNIPGVEAVGYTNRLPMRGGWGGGFSVESPEIPMGRNDDSDFQIVSSDYFTALRIKLLRGRLFSSFDASTSEPVVLVNRAFAHRYWPNSDPIGHRVTKGTLPPFRIVGVVDDVHLGGPATPANIEIYFAATQAQGLPVSPSDVAVRTAGDPLLLFKAIQSEVWSLDKDQPVTGVRTLDEELTASTSGARFNTILLGLFAGLALLLAAVGIYGILSYSIAQRAPEIGIRIAVGASPADILKLVFRQVGSLITIGVILGLNASVALSRYVSTMLFGVAPHDPTAIIVAVVALVAAGLIAAFIPARRALRIQPISVLRVD